MNDLPRQKLRELIFEYGRSLCDDPRRCEALLKDYCGEHKREIFVLVNALKSRALDDVIKAKSAGIPESIMWSRARQRLEEELAMTTEAAQWAVESWAFALGLTVPPPPSGHVNTTSGGECSSTAIRAFIRVLVANERPGKPLNDYEIVKAFADQGIELARRTVVKYRESMGILPSSERKHLNSQDTSLIISGRYRDNGDGTVTDVKTGLQWMRCSLGQAWNGRTCTGEAEIWTWYKAQEEVDHFNRQGGYAGHRDWR